jgi:mRNA interferase MazF
MPKGDLRYRRGEIWWVNLDPTMGSETAKKRPCVILQTVRSLILNKEKELKP